MRIAPELARELLDYNPQTGVLTWKIRPLSHFTTPQRGVGWNNRYAGKVTGCPDHAGYLRINIRGYPYLAHHLAWAIYYGEHPALIDHKNRDPADNRIDNLRAATRSNNQHNRTAMKTNTSGYKGVSFHKKTGKWRANVFFNSKQHYLGLFADPQKAYAAYCKAAKELHGEFARG
jgi:hypothetical protein